MQILTMNNGLEIPLVGYGVFQMTSTQVREYLPQALDLGYRHVDTANAYFNEVAVGQVIAESSVPREDLFVTSKLFPQSYPYARCTQDIDATLERLDLDYLDLLLFHQPYGEYVQGWEAMEEAVSSGKVRSIGLSNFPIHKVQKILAVAEITPAVMQVEINPYWNQHELKTQLSAHQIVFEGWYPLGHGDKQLLAEPVFTRLAEKYGKSAAQIILRWHMQENNVVFPKTLDPQHLVDNLAVFDFALTDQEMAEINALPQQPYYVVPETAPAFAMAEHDYSRQA